jgi:hypothetical protein
MKAQLNVLTATRFFAAFSAAIGQSIIITQPQSLTHAVGTTATF